jgi:hypothetical protein
MRSTIAALVTVCGVLAAPGIAQADDGATRDAQQAVAVEAGAFGTVSTDGLGSRGFVVARIVIGPSQPAIIDPITLAKCVAAIGAFIAGNTLIIVKVRKAGGVIKVAKKLLQAGSSEERLTAALAIFGDISGVTALVENCA